MTREEELRILIMQWEIEARRDADAAEAAAMRRASSVKTLARLRAELEALTKGSENR